MFTDVPVARSKALISFPEYSKICYMITHHIRRLEEESEAAEGTDKAREFLTNGKVD